MKRATITLPDDLEGVADILCKVFNQIVSLQNASS